MAKQVYACITVNRQKCFIALQQSIDLRYWDERRGAGKGGRQDSLSINNYLEQVRLAIGNCYQNLQLKGRIITAEIVKDSFLGTAEEVHTLSSLFEYHNETAASVLKWSTLKHYYVTQRYLVKFIQNNSSQQTCISMSLITSSFMTLKLSYVIINLLTTRSH
jgi:hypothetical protein